MGYQGKVIEEPKTKGAHRVWELLEPFNQAEAGWRGLGFAVGEGYSLAWNRQSGILNNIKQQMLLEIEQSNFILGILLAGVAGGLMGPIMAGGFAKVAGKLAEGVTESLGRKLTASVVNGLGSEAAKRTATRYLTDQASFGNAFSPAGVDPTSYGARLQTNVSTLFMFLRRVIAGIITELEAGNRPLAEGQEYYKGFLAHPAISAFPDDRDIQDADFERDAALALWISWGAQRDFPYWDKVWIEATKKSRNSFEDVIRKANIHEITRFDPILNEISRLSPAGLVRVAVMLDGWWHLDIRRLKDLGNYDSPESLKALSRYFGRPNKPMTFSAGLQLAMTMGDKAFDKLDAATK